MIHVWPDGTSEVIVADDFTETWGSLAVATARAIANSVHWFEDNGSDWVAQQASAVPIYHAPFFVVVGHFEGATLVDNGSLSATPEDPGTSPFDRLMVA